MKSDKEVIEQVDKKNHTQKGGAKKEASNAKNYASRCTGVGLYKMFAALPEEEKGALRTTYFVLLLLIEPIATMSTLVVEIFDRHLGDMKFQFGGTIIQMKPIHVCLILGLRVSPIANEFLFVDPEHMTNFRMRRFPKKNNTYWLKEIDDALKQAKLERHHDDVLRLNLLKIILSFLLPIKGGNVRAKYVDLRNHIEAPAIGTTPIIEPTAVGALVVGALIISSSSSSIEIGAVVVRQVAPGEGLEVVKDLMVDDDVEVRREVNLKPISSEYGGNLLEWKKGEIGGEEKAEDDKEQPQVANEEEASPDQTTAISAEEQTIEVVKTEDKFGQASIEQATVVFIEEQTTEVAKTEDEASQTKKSKEKVEQSKGEVLEGKDDDDGNSQKKPDPVQVIKEMAIDQTNLVLMESKVDVTLKKRHALIDAKINERAFKMACQIDQLHAHLDELLSGLLLQSCDETVCLNALYTLYPKKWLENEVIDTHTKALIQYFDTQHRARPDNEKIVLANVFACQYIDRDFNVWTRNMSFPEGVELKKKLIWEQITSMQWDRTISNCIHRGDLKVVNSKLGASKAGVEAFAEKDCWLLEVGRLTVTCWNSAGGNKGSLVERIVQVEDQLLEDGQGLAKRAGPSESRASSS
ncbi:hypothetical protein GIB67_040427 [Kingdonia uniflora]|uniref:Uncharacterized protein n=1 Tax=Kingdonia uniflora TaxID=39325 RepID=A0A7J7KXN5_9MAGN|nr:hypothetical protein GIB67_040427 [Kingdonia uniflora]